MKKIYIALFTILIAATILVIWKRNIWFGNPPEAAYTTSQAPERILLTVGENGDTQRNVSWLCDTILTQGNIEITQEGSKDTLHLHATGAIVKSRSGKSAFYKVQLSGLVPGKSYAYRVHNNALASRWFSFHMPKTEDNQSFVYVGDNQDYENGNSHQLFQNIHKRYPNVAFWALGGDIIERPTNAYWSYWYSTMDSIAGQVPLIAATGNHEYLKGITKTLDSRWTYSFFNPENGPNGFIGRSYYVDFKDICFIVIDSDGIQGPVSLYNHRVWLKKILSATTKKWKIVMMHHPVYSVREGRSNYYVRWTFKPLFEKYGVDIVLQGHDHGYSRITTKNGQKKQTPVYIVSSCSPKFYVIGFDQVHDRLGSNIQLYQHIAIQNDTLKYQAFTQDGQPYDDLAIIHTAGQTSTVVDNAVDWPEQLDLPLAFQNGKINLKKYQQNIEERKLYKKQLSTIP